MNIIVIIKFMRISFEVSSVAATKLPGGWWALDSIMKFMFSQSLAQVLVKYVSVYGTKDLCWL